MEYKGYTILSRDFVVMDSMGRTWSFIVADDCNQDVACGFTTLSGAKGFIDRLVAGEVKS